MKIGSFPTYENLPGGLRREADRYDLHRDGRPKAQGGDGVEWYIRRRSDGLTQGAKDRGPCASRLRDFFRHVSEDKQLPERLELTAAGRAAAFRCSCHPAVPSPPPRPPPPAAQGRNAPCPCGSGHKTKRCADPTGPHHAEHLARVRVLRQEAVRAGREKAKANRAKLSRRLDQILAEIHAKASKPRTPAKKKKAK